MHEEQVNVADVVDEEGLVAGGVEVAGLLVGTVSDLYKKHSISVCPAFLTSAAFVVESMFPSLFLLLSLIFSLHHCSLGQVAYLGHRGSALEPPPHAVVDTLRLPP